jgi:AcrR family transcriptional regulator
MRRATSAEADMKREEILRTAASLFADKGFHSTGMRDICSAVDLSPGALYRYFASKEDIISAIINRDREQTRKWFSEVPPNMGLIEAITLVLRSAIQSMESQDYLPVWIESQAEASRSEQVRQVVFSHTLEAESKLVCLLEAAQKKRGIAKDVDPKAAAQWILATFDGLMVRRSIEPGFDFARLARICLQFIAHALGAPQPRSSLKN